MSKFALISRSIRVGSEGPGASDTDVSLCVVGALSHTAFLGLLGGVRNSVSARKARLQERWCSGNGVTATHAGCSVGAEDLAAMRKLGGIRVTGFED